jgi:putative heme-binding domain-containing protein
MLPARILVLVLFVCAAVPLAAQHVYTDDEIAEGGRLYEVSCSKCHGAAGNAITGIDLAAGKFRKPMQDDQLAQVIRTGIPNSTMAPSNLSEAQVGTVIAYMRSMSKPSGTTKIAGSNLPAGDVARGKLIVESTKADCLRCHRIGSSGSRMGPDLTDVGTRRQQAQIELALVVPNAEVLPVNRTVRVVTANGDKLTGRILNHDTLALLIIDTNGQLRSFQKSTLREWALVDSPMPSYRGKLTPQELADLISYLVSLKGQVNP